MTPSRNAPCPCGSGKKYKHCCAGKTAPQAPTPADFNQLAVLFKSGRYVELERHTRMLLEQYPEAGLVWKLLCIALQMQGKDTLLALQKAAKFLPNDAEIHNNLGNVLQAHGQHAEAAASLRRALMLAPDFVEAHANLGNALKDLGQLDAAVASYRRVLKINPNIAELHSNLGAVLHELQQFDEAVASHRRALEPSLGAWPVAVWDARGVVGRPSAEPGVGGERPDRGSGSILAGHGWSSNHRVGPADG